ncbi:futalosine hydrolase [Aureliella helgolandensis]|uniref:Futalosine hydrolase n=1 Tax=Aureliella helgolandensis TaxID=2527968 RepID=A0A518GGU9_9BACT|nr:futalosine hydrolase [Aureliella helgolandensis]QDV27826.1 Aminodeoxyfutalosine nucleosidase [Aureliella helgolandensis]
MTTDLILIPTQLERNTLQPYLDEADQHSQSPHTGGTHLQARPQLRIALCGFGPIVSAARAVQLLQTTQAERVWLLGIAGTLTNQLRIGQAYTFDATACYGIGAGTGAAHQSAASMGWKQWPQSPQIGDTLPLTVSPAFHQDSATTAIAKGVLLTCPSASADREDVALRRQAYSDACAEDMEGFSVATACHLLNTPLHIIRGISNQAGDRDHNQWKIDQALRAVGELFLRARDSQPPSQLSPHR